MKVERTLLRNRPKDLQKEQPVNFHRSFSDSSHFIVSRFCLNRKREIIGHLHIEVHGERTIYISKDTKGRELYPPTTEFAEAELNFEKYAVRRALQEKANDYYKEPLTINNLTSKKSNVMTTSNNPTEQKKTKNNQLTFLKYEFPTKDGHYITVGDSYKNLIARIHQTWNDDLKKYDYTAYDHAGNFIAKKEKLWELEKVFTDNRQKFLEDAHQRRIASKAKSKDASKEKSTETQPVQVPDKADAKVNQKETGRTPAKENAPTNKEQSRQQEREQELADLRDDQADERGDMDVER